MVSPKDDSYVPCLVHKPLALTCTIVITCPATERARLSPYFIISESCHESETLESQLILCFTHRTQIRKLNE